MACSFCFFLRLVPPELTLFGFTASHMVVELFLYVIIYSSLTLSIFILLCYIYLLIDLIMLAKVSEFVWYWVGCREILFHVSLPLEMLAPLSLQPKLRQRLIFFGFSQIDLWFVNNLSFFFFKWINGFCTFEKFLYDFAILLLILVPYGFVNMVLPYSTAGIQVYGIQVLWTSLRGNHLALTKLKIKSICHCFTFKNSVMYKCYVKMLIFHILVAVLLTICIWYVVL